MKLLFDQNLPPRLSRDFAELFAGSRHVRDLGLHQVPDQEIWNFAADHDFTIVTKDFDFGERSFLFGFPPKVILLAVGNCSAAHIAKLLHDRSHEIERFLRRPDRAILICRR